MLVIPSMLWGIGFSPKQIAGLALWLDASDATTITFGSGSLISAWKDKSTNALSFNQGTPANQPTQHVAGQNGLNTITLNSASTIFLRASSGLNITSGYTALCIVNRTSTSVFSIPLGSSTSANSYTMFWFSDSKIYVGGTASRGISTAQTVSTFNLLTTQQNASETGGIQRFNGVDVTGTTDAVVGSMTNLDQIGFIGADGTDGDIAEYILYNTVLTLTQIQQVERYLRNKWATP